MSIDPAAARRLPPVARPAARWRARPTSINTVALPWMPSDGRAGSRPRASRQRRRRYSRDRERRRGGPRIAPPAESRRSPSGNVSPINSAGTATSTSIGLPLNQSSPAPVPIRIARSVPSLTPSAAAIRRIAVTTAPMARASVRASPSSADTTKSACPTINQSGGARAAVQETGDERAAADTDQDDRQQQREHCAEPAEQNRQVTEPQDLHPHRRKARHRQRERDVASVPDVVSGFEPDRARRAGPRLRPDVWSDGQPCPRLVGGAGPFWSDSSGDVSRRARDTTRPLRPPG